MPENPTSDFHHAMAVVLRAFKRFDIVTRHIVNLIYSTKASSFWMPKMCDESCLDVAALKSLGSVFALFPIDSRLSAHH
jgi:hypothetical protein